MTDNRRPLAGHVAIVTGAGSGLGRAHALTLARLGARIVVNELSTAVNAAKSLCAEIAAAGGEAVTLLASVSDPNSSEQLVAAALDRFDRLDIIVCNAGVLRPGLFPAVDDETWQLHQSVHADAAFYLARAAWPTMIANNYGRIVLTTSSGGLFGAPGLAAYGASKLSVVGVLKVLAVEASETGIRVNAVAPLASTPMSQAGGRTGSTAQILGAAFDAYSPEQVSAIVAALCHPQCPAQGQVLACGGGRVAEIVIAETAGIRSTQLNCDEVLARWDEICARDTLAVPRTMREELALYKK